MTQKRNNSIDFVKGILILSVVIGHILLGNPRDNILRYMIYSVHMPLFIGISGYLMHYEKIARMSFVELVKKYFFRVGIPWIIAVNIYFLLTNMELLLNVKAAGIEIIGKAYVEAYIRPYLHLWYVPAFLIYVFLTWAVIRVAKCYWKDKKNVYMILGTFAGIVSIISFYNKVPSIKLYYFIFFVLGMMMKELFCSLGTEKKRFQGTILIFSILFLSIRVILFFTDYKIAQQVSLYYYVLNIPLLALLISRCEARVFPKVRILEFLGRESLTFYLWHMLGRNVVVAIVGRESQLWYYILNMIVVILEIILIYMGKKIIFIDKYIFGNIRPRVSKRSEELANAELK